MSEISISKIIITIPYRGKLEAFKETKVSVRGSSLLTFFVSTPFV